VQADFDRLALLDDEGWTANNHYHDSLLKLVPQSCENALEIGCGTGGFARKLAKRCKRVVGIDMSREMIRVARKRSEGMRNAERVASLDAVGKVEFVLADAMRWEFPREKFDFVCSIATLHHTPQRELLMKMRDALKPNGVLVVLDLAQSMGFVERMMDVVGFGVGASLRLIHNGRLQPPLEVRKAWEQHGKHDHYSTVTQMRALAGEIMPGATVKRCLLWRYLLVYQKAENEDIQISREVTQTNTD
jgi:SAM-dependent methyltransferase